MWPRKVLSSWDRFVVHKPFAKAIVGFGPALWIPSGGKTEICVATWGPKVEEAMQRLNEKIERELMDWAGRTEGRKASGHA